MVGAGPIGAFPLGGFPITRFNLDNPEDERSILVVSDLIGKRLAEYFHRHPK